MAKSTWEPNSWVEFRCFQQSFCVFSTLWQQQQFGEKSLFYSSRAVLLCTNPTPKRHEFVVMELKWTAVRPDLNPNKHHWNADCGSCHPTSALNLRNSIFGWMDTNFQRHNPRSCRKSSQKRGYGDGSKGGEGGAGCNFILILVVLEGWGCPTILYDCKVFTKLLLYST